MWSNFFTLTDALHFHVAELYLEKTFTAKNAEKKLNIKLNNSAVSATSAVKIVTAQRLN
jgi:hypothetical protein